MSVIKSFNSHFSEENLKKIFEEHVVYSNATGIDNVNQYAFRKQLDEQIEILSRKMLNGTYRFSKYKLKLISKGRGKAPREISIPTVRDRIAMRAICNFLGERYRDEIDFELPQDVIRSVKSEIEVGGYSGCIKLDVTNFYPSIRHDKLKPRLNKRIRNSDILDIIFSAIKSPTVSISKPTDKEIKIGVPQGLSISNILAAIYLVNIDKYMDEYPNIKAYRFVDDILILCDISESSEVALNVIKRIKSKSGLTVHDPVKVPEKSSITSISEGFDYLGYSFRSGVVSARAGSVDSLKNSILAIFTAYKHADPKIKNVDFLMWRLNLRITGCVFENKCKGWLFFFSEINNENLLHQLDHFVSKICKRFGVPNQSKRFVRAFKEIKHNKKSTKYIPNFDVYTIDQMKFDLAKYFNFDVSKITDDEVEFYFHKKIGRHVKELLEDIKDFS